MRWDTSVSGIKVASSCDKLIIVGSGRVAWYVYKFASMLDYSITIIDDDAESLTRDRFPEASELLLGDVVQVLAKYSVDENTSIVILTRHHEYDKDCLMAVIDTPARYIGIMSNKRAVTAYFSELESLEVSEESMARIYTPIGLDTGGQLASEIALAIVAEIQAVRYKRPGGFMIIKQSHHAVKKRDEWF